MGVLTELRRRIQVSIARPRHWQLRPNTFDRRAFRDAVIHNVYRLPPKFDSNDVVIDIGAHIGSFSLAALRRGAGLVVCCEADPTNLRVLTENLQPYAPRARVIGKAVWRSDRPVTSLSFQNDPDARATGRGMVSTDAAGNDVPAIAFDNLIDQSLAPGQQLRMLKLDCEGSEWPILLTSRRLDRVQAICGEYHLGEYSSLFAVDGFPEFTPSVLHRFLEQHGFRVQSEPLPKLPHLGLFFADRPM